MRNDVAKLRKDKGLSQAKLGDSLRHPVSRQTINAVENGRYDPGIWLALDLAHFFKRHVEEIFHVD